PWMQAPLERRRDSGRRRGLRLETTCLFSGATKKPCTENLSRELGRGFRMRRSPDARCVPWRRIFRDWRAASSCEARRAPGLAHLNKLHRSRQSTRVYPRRAEPKDVLALAAVTARARVPAAPPT